jgi:hypothetical protein
VAWILAFRPNQGSAQLLSATEHLDHSGAERIVLGPLDDAAVAQVAEDVIDAEPDDALLDLVKGAHGSPFVLTELLSGLRDEDLIRVVAGRAELVEARLPRRVRFTMRERLRSVPAPALRINRLAEFPLSAAKLPLLDHTSLQPLPDHPPSGERAELLKDVVVRDAVKRPGQICIQTHRRRGFLPLMTWEIDWIASWQPRLGLNP